MAVTPIYGIPYQSLTDPPNGATLGSALALEVEAELQRIDAAKAATDAVLAAAAGINGVAIASGTTTSATYVDLPATSSFSFTKTQASSRLSIAFHITSFVAGAVGTVVRFAVQINGVDYDICHAAPSTASVREQSSGVTLTPAGIPAGTYTVKGRWRRVSGAGTPTLDGAFEWLSIQVREVP